jgi:hypothetical protein
MVLLMCHTGLEPEAACRLSAGLPPRDVLNAAAGRSAAPPDGGVNSDLVDATLFGVLAAVP